MTCLTWCCMINKMGETDPLSKTKIGNRSTDVCTVPAWPGTAW